MTPARPLPRRRPSGRTRRSRFGTRRDGHAVGCVPSPRGSAARGGRPGPRRPGIHCSTSAFHGEATKNATPRGDSPRSVDNRWTLRRSSSTRSRYRSAATAASERGNSSRVGNGCSATSDGQRPAPSSSARWGANGLIEPDPSGDARVGGGAALPAPEDVHRRRREGTVTNTASAAPRRSPSSSPCRTVPTTSCISEVSHASSSWGAPAPVPERSRDHLLHVPEPAGRVVDEARVPLDVLGEVGGGRVEESERVGAPALGRLLEGRDRPAFGADVALGDLLSPGGGEPPVDDHPTGLEPLRQEEGVGVEEHREVDSFVLLPPDVGVQRIPVEELLPDLLLERKVHRRLARPAPEEDAVEEGVGEAGDREPPGPDEGAHDEVGRVESGVRDRLNDP